MYEDLIPSMGNRQSSWERVKLSGFEVVRLNSLSRRTGL